MTACIQREMIFLLCHQVAGQQYIHVAMILE